MEDVSGSLREISRKIGNLTPDPGHADNQDTQPRIDRIELLEGRVAYLEKMISRKDGLPAFQTEEPEITQMPAQSAETGDPFPPLFEGEEEEDGQQTVTAEPESDEDIRPMSFASESKIVPGSEDPREHPVLGKH